LESQEETWRCPKCGELICCHNGLCFHCDLDELRERALTHNLSQLKYFQMQCIKESSTLRVSSKKDKPMPRIVFHYGKQDGQIREFLEFRSIIKQIFRRLQNRKETEETKRALSLGGT
jgi:hypothetical protein